MELQDKTLEELTHMRDELDKLIFYILKTTNGQVTPEFSLAVKHVTAIKREMETRQDA